MIERRNHIIVKKLSAILKHKLMSWEFWGEAINKIVYLLNQAPTKCLEGMTLYEVWIGRKPHISYLKVFECVIYVKTLDGGLKKLEDQNKLIVFIRYERGSKGYRAYNVTNEKRHLTKDVTFDGDKKLELGQV